MQSKSNVGRGNVFIKRGGRMHVTQYSEMISCFSEVGVQLTYTKSTGISVISLALYFNM